MVGAAEGDTERPADAAEPVGGATPAADGQPVPVPFATRALLLGAAVVFLVLPAVAMLVMLTSGPGLSILFDGAFSEFGKQLSSVGNSL
jgi:hypothetical protein